MIEKKFYGERLRSARMYRGLTLTELAKRTEISKQSISLYENDNNTPDYMKVRLLASELNFPYDYFFQKDSYAAKTETTYFRSLASATKKDRTAQSIKLEYVSLLKSLSAGIIHFGLFVNSADDNCRIGSMNSVLSEFWICDVIYCLIGCFS